MTKPNQTLAERYRALRTARLGTYQVTSPSGMEWTLTRVTPQDYFLANELPFQISQKVADSLNKGKSNEEAFQELAPREQQEWLLFVRKLVHEAIVYPKVVDHATEPDEIDFVLPEDFEFLVAEVMGGEAARTAATFRARREQAVMGGADGKKRRAKS